MNIIDGKKIATEIRDGVKKEISSLRITPGLAVILVSQIFINIGMNLGLLPVIGIPLPLVSYGGSSLLTTFAGLDIVLSIRLRI